ncbi:MAG: hypothetical protein ACRYF3_15900 [Janthinobacterium lividum]
MTAGTCGAWVNLPDPGELGGSTMLDKPAERWDVEGRVPGV